ncbi:MAG: hypothetical protein ACK48X_11790 [Planctomycetota bacterium]|jgi:hypothetical protein
MSSRSILILAVMFVAFAGCQRDTSFLPGEFDSVTIYSLECDFDNSSLPADAELFHGNLVLGKAEVSKEMGEKVVAALRADIAKGSTINNCFLPHHAIRVMAGGKELDILICYKCRGFERTKNGKLVTTSFPMDVQSRQTLNAILHSNGIELSPAATEEIAK